MSYNVMLEGLIKDIGGCGKFQWCLCAIMHLSKTIAAWTMLHMTFNGQEPTFFCRNNVYGVGYNQSEDSCSTVNGTDCTSFRYDDEMHTAVSEWDLLCDKKWIVATITTIQMGGVLVGCFIAGHLGDWIGRKPTYYIAMLILVLFNVVAYFSISWEMYAAVRFMLGAGDGFFITIIYNEMVEFTTATWRPRVLSVPSWALESCGFAFVAWIFKDWKNIHLASAVVGAPFFLFWWFVPESFRWLVTKGRYDDAEAVIDRVAKLNGYEKPDLTTIIKQAKLEEEQKQHYTVIELFKTKESTIKTLALLFMWMGESYAYYGLTFGIKFLPGNLYLNMFVVNLVEVPGSLSAMYLMNRFGRKKTCLVAMFLTGLCGIADGVLQYVDSPAKNGLITAFYIGARVGIAIGWGALMVLTMEVYPTVIRTTAYGASNTVARVGSMIAPQIVFLNDIVPGMMFFLSGAIMLISTLLCFLFKETKDLVLEDAIKKRSIQENCLEIQDTIVQTSDGLEVKKSFNLKEENGTIVANF